LPERGPTDKLREISITTTAPGTVSLASVSIYNNRSGVTYNSVGYVGAQASLLNKMSEKLFADDLARINPQIVVLSFGTNEASNEHLDIAQYSKGYERLLGKIKAVPPAAAIVLIGPPDFNELPASCPPGGGGLPPCAGRSRPRLECGGAGRDRARERSRMRLAHARQAGAGPRGATRYCEAPGTDLLELGLDHAERVRRPSVVHREPASHEPRSCSFHRRGL
jgi:hypothetical protein